MILLFQRKNKTYAFSSTDEQLMDVDEIIRGIDEGRYRASSSSPKEFYESLPPSLRSAVFYSKVEEDAVNHIRVEQTRTS